MNENKAKNISYFLLLLFAFSVIPKGELKSSDNTLSEDEKKDLLTVIESDTPHLDVEMPSLVEKLCKYGPRALQFLEEQRGKHFWDNVIEDAIAIAVFCLKFNLPPEVARCYRFQLSEVAKGGAYLMTKNMKKKSLDPNIERKIEKATRERNLNELLALVYKVGEKPYAYNKIIESIVKVLDKNNISALLSEIPKAYDKDNELFIIPFTLIVALRASGDLGRNALCDVIKRERENAHPAFIAALAFFKDSKKTDFFIELISIKKPFWKLNFDRERSVIEAVKALTILGSPSSFKPLKELLNKMDDHHIEEKAEIIKALSYSMPKNETFHFHEFLSDDEVGVEALVALTRLKDKSAWRIINGLIKKSPSWILCEHIAEYFALLNPEEAPPLLVRMLHHPRWASVVEEALARCWGSATIRELAKRMPQNRYLSPEEISPKIFRILISSKNLEKESLRLIIETFQKDQPVLRHNILYLLTRLAHTYKSIPLFLLLLHSILDPDVTIRRMLASNMPMFCSEPWGTLLPRLISEADYGTISRVVDKRLRLFNSVKDYIYYDALWETGEQKLRVDEEAKQKGIPIHPYTGRPLTKEELEEVRKERAEYKKLLEQLREEQNNAWQKVKEQIEKERWP